MIAQPQTDVGQGQTLKPVSTRPSATASGSAPVQVPSSAVASSGWRNVSALSSLEGQVRIFTAAHRHFFTHVFSQALRDAGQGTSVLMVQFFKGGINRGPSNPTHLGQNLDWVRCELPHSINATPDSDADRNAVLSLWEYTCDVVQAEQYEQVILEELSLAMFYGIVPESEVLELLENRPRSMDITLTGQRMPRAILRAANQVTELRNLFDVPLDSPLPSLKPRRLLRQLPEESLTSANPSNPSEISLSSQRNVSKELKKRSTNLAVSRSQEGRSSKAAATESWISPGQMQIPGLWRT